MKHVVITGSTRGIGYGLADAFLERGCRVMISGRTQASVDKAVNQLAEAHGSQNVAGQPCDVVQLDQVESLWQQAAERFGPVDIWINNSGISHQLLPMWELPSEDLANVVDTNITGTLYGSRVAIRGMLEQGHGQLYNMMGFGSNGSTRVGMAVYGTSKSAVKYLTDILVKETQGTPIQVCSLSPGMVVTDLLVDQLKVDPEAFERSKGVLDILSDRVETVTPWLADKVLANEKRDARIKYLSTPKIVWRFLSSPFIKRDPFGGTL